MTRKERYNIYIHSEKWFAIREQAFELHGRKCRKCSSPFNLHVHHKTYTRFEHENIETDLIPLCKRCHKKLHKFCRKVRMDLWHGTEAFMNGAVIEKVSGKRRKKRNRGSGRRQGYRIRMPHRELTKMVVPTGAARVKKAGAVDVQKFMVLYGLDEMTARALIQ